MEHTPVLLRECIEGLNIRPGGIYVDGTICRGGHAAEIAKRLRSGRLIGIDRDAEAIDEAGGRLKEFGGRITLVHGNFEDISAILDSYDINAVDGMLFDLGISSPQLESARRGFSHMRDGPLDMRMDQRDEQTAFMIVNQWPEEKLRQVLYDYGEERYARQIAFSIVKKREKAPVNTTFDLNDIILSAIPPSARREQQHPSKRCFQALRLAVNNELGAITEMLVTAPDRLEKGGRLCIISFHSLEDRLVKNAFNARAKGCECPKDFPVCVCGKKPELKIVTRKPITPGGAELSENPRARSAKLRIAEKI